MPPDLRSSAAEGWHVKPMCSCGRGDGVDGTIFDKVGVGAKIFGSRDGKQDGVTRMGESHVREGFGDGNHGRGGVKTDGGIEGGS